VNALRYKVSIIKRLVYHLPRWAIVKLLDGIIFSNVRYCLPLWGSMRLTHRAEEPENQFSKRIQVQINNALRLALGVKLKDHTAVKVLQEKTNTLSFNQLVIQSTHRLTEKILSGHCKGLKDFYDKTEEPTMITRSTDKGDLTTTTVKNIPNPGFRAQSVRLYNKLTDDRK
jgi:hypothetical protein